MEAMIMGYTVDPPSRLDKLKVGDAVRFNNETQQKANVKIEKLKQ
jgi:Cu/Ag efflux protein CusF